MDTKFTDAAHVTSWPWPSRRRGMQRGFIGTEHLLIGLIDEDSGVVGDVLRTVGMDAARIHREIERLVQRGPQPVKLHTLPLTPRSKRALEYAAAESRLMDEQHVGPEHILLGLFRDTVRNLFGRAALMGVGGVMAMGCTYGQAITGVSTLALGSSWLSHRGAGGFYGFEGSGAPDPRRGVAVTGLRGSIGEQHAPHGGTLYRPDRDPRDGRAVFTVPGESSWLRSTVCTTRTKSRPLSAARRAALP